MAQDTENKRTRTPKERQTAAGAANLAEFRKTNERPALKHGVRALIATGSVPPVEGAADIIANTDAILAEMASDLGGDSEITGQRRAILESQSICLLVLGLASAYMRREGLLNSAGKPHPLLGTVVSFANTLRLNAMALGLERKSKKIGTLGDYIQHGHVQHDLESK